MLQVFGFEDRRHAAAAENFDHPEAAVNHLSRLKGSARRIHGVVMLRDFPAGGHLLERAGIVVFHAANVVARNPGG